MLNQKHTIELLGGLASVATIISFFRSTPFFQEKKIKVDCYSERMLSFGTKVDSLIVQYNGKTIDDVWKLRFVLNNVGMQSIIGSGAYSALLNDRLIMKIDSNYQIISYNIPRNDLDANFQQAENSFTIMFKKWKPNEMMQIEVLATPVVNNKVYPSMSMNERDVTGAKVVVHNVDYAKIEDSSNNLDWLVYLKSNYPRFLFKIAKWVGLFFVVVMCIAPLVLTIQFTSIPEAPEPESIGMLLIEILVVVLIFGPFIVYGLFAWFNL